MSNEFEKYAVYWVPRYPDALARFGAAWTGWCAEQGEPRSGGMPHNLSFDIPTITRQVWRHGFHAVINAPFRLGAGRSLFSVEHVLGLLAEDNVAIKLPRLRLAVVDGCVALVPGENCTKLGNLVARVGAAIAPLDAAAPANGFAGVSPENSDASRAPVPGGDATEDHDTVIQLPIVDAHRFHMPLTDQLGVEMAFRVKKELEPVLEPMLDEPRRLQDLALMGDPGQGRPLRVLQRYDLRETPMRRASHALPCYGPNVLVSTRSNPLTKAEIAL